MVRLEIVVARLFQSLSFYALCFHESSSHDQSFGQGYFYKGHRHKDLGRAYARAKPTKRPVEDKTFCQLHSFVSFLG